MIIPQFDIRKHLDKLELGKAKNFYTCPVCEGHRLGVNPKNGAFQCWSGGCSTNDIREAIRPLAEFLAECKEERPAQQTRKPKAKKEYPPAPIPLGAKLLRLPAPGKPPRAERPKYFPQGVPHNAAQITYSYSGTQKVLRFEWQDPTHPKGRDKTYRQIHTDFNGKQIWSKGDARWSAYLINEIVELLKNIPDGEPIIILIVEGEPNVELARLHGIAALTLQGSNWSHSEIQIMLETLRATGKNVSVAMLRDNDDTGLKKGQDVRLVARHIQFPCIVIDPRVIYPDIPEKGDIQEILEAIGPDEFLSRMNSEIASQTTSEPRDTAVIRSISKENKKKAWALTHPIAWDCNQRYLDIPYPNSGIICIKSPKGTGKTYALKKLVAKAQAEGRKVLVLTHRIVLGRAICSIVEIPWIEEMNSDGDRKIEGNALGHGLCIDSLHPTSQALFDPTAFENALVILDEAEQVLWHALNSSTCRENRQAILASLKTLIQTVLSSGGQFVLQDADLSDISIDFVRDFSGVDVKPWISVNHWQPSEPWKVKFYDTQYVKGGTKDDPSGLLKDSVDHVTNGGKVWVSLDSQKAKSKYGTKNLEKYYRSRCPGKKILRIDAESVANPEHPAYQCAEKINELVAHYDIVISSPSLATGVSVNLRGHFTAVFGIFQGAISDNEVRQSLARVREPVNRFVWCRQIAVGKIGNGESNYKEVAKSTEKDCRYNLHLLKDFDFDIDKAYNPTVLKYWAKFAARINSSIWDFRETVREGLVAEGHILQDCGDDDRDSAGEIKALRIAGQVEEAISVSNAPDIDKDEFEKLEQQRTKTDIEQYQEEKFRLGEIYKTEVTPELRQLHQDRWHEKIRLDYYLSHDENFIWMRDRKNIDSQIKSGGGQLCLQDIRQLTGKVTVHRLLNILQFCDPTKEWSNKSPEVLEFVDKALKIAADVKTLTGITVSPKKAADNPIGIVQSFLAQLGLKLTGEQRRVGEERVRFYKFGGKAPANVFDRAGNKIGEPQGLRAEIFEQWKERDELALFEFQQNGVPAVEADVTLDLKPSASKVRVKKDLYLGSVTASPIDIENIPSVTTDPTIGTPSEREEPQPEPAGRMGWVSRWGKWVRASFVAATDGAQFRILIQEVTGWNEVFAWPHQLRWDAPT